MTRPTTIAGHAVGPNEKLLLIAGPCQAESYELCVRIGAQLRDTCAKLGFNYIFKASFDKANRSSIHSQRGPGLDEGLELLAKIKATLGVPLTTDIHEPHQARKAADAGVDLLQIPAFLCRQTDLLVACAKTGHAINVKKGQFLSPAEMTNVVVKLDEATPGRRADADATRSPYAQTLLTERGTFFGYHRLVNDFVGVADMMDLEIPGSPAGACGASGASGASGGPPVCFDVTHSTQHPGSIPGPSGGTGGRRDRAPLLARCAVAAGVHALFIETHPDPDRALSDAATTLPLSTMPDLLRDLATLHDTCRQLTVR